MTVVIKDQIWLDDMNKEKKKQKKKQKKKKESEIGMYVYVFPVRIDQSIKSVRIIQQATGFGIDSLFYLFHSQAQLYICMQMGWENRSMQIRLGTLKQTMKINMKVREKKKEKKLALENWRKISTILSKLSSTNKKNRIHTIIQERKKREKKKDQACLYYIIYIYIQAG